MAVEPSGDTSISSPPKNRVKSAEDRPAGSPIPDSGTGVHCHQCRQKSRGIAAACRNQRKSKPCLVKLCSKCLLNRYGENAEEVVNLDDWMCPKCRGICNCSVCMKRRGHRPTGILINTAKETGFSSVSDMLLKSAERLNHGDVDTNMDEKVPRKRGKENSLDGKLDDHLPKSKAKKLKRELNGNTVDNAALKICNQDEIEANQERINKEKMLVLPLGIEMTSVAGIDVAAEDVGNALEFLEFCSVFGKILELKDGEAEYVLQDILNERAAHRGKLSPTVQFHILLLTIIQTEQGEKFEKLNPSYGKNSWFEALKKSFSASQRFLKASAVDSLEKADEYDALNASEKLRLLSMLCVELLGTKKLRNWIENQHTQIGQKAKEAKQKALDAREQMKTLQQKLRDDVAKSIDARDAEHEATVSHTKSEIEQTRAKLLEANGMLSNLDRRADAQRVEPVFTGHSGHVYWKLNYSGKSDILHQCVGEGDTLTLNEKWSTLSDEEKEVIEKYINTR